MTDPIWPTGPSYRPSRRRRGPNRQARRVLLAAAVLMTVLLTVLGGGLLRPDGPVPVTEAENRPFRVPPADPGGLQAPGLAVQVLGGEADLPVALAPPPEGPAATALRARTQAPEGPETVDPPDPLAAADATPPEALSDAPASGASRPAIEQQVTPVMALPIPRPAPSSQPGGGTGKVQLAAVGSQADARSEWRRLSRQAPELLGGRTSMTPLHRVANAGSLAVPGRRAACRI